MARKPTIIAETTKEYLAQYPDMPIRTLAKLLRKDHPKLYATIDTARASVRYYRGRTGSAHRRVLADRTFMLPPPTEDNPFSLPDAWHQPWKPYVIGPKYDRILVLADAHIPFHDMEALTVALTAAKKYKPNCIILNGDWWDCYALSTWEKNSAHD